MKKGSSSDFFFRPIYTPSSLEKSRRRKEAFIHRKRIRYIADCSGWFPGPWYCKEKGRVINSGRGSGSRYLKNTGNRKVRHSFCASGGYYRKIYDYWWNLT